MPVFMGDRKPDEREGWMHGRPSEEYYPEARKRGEWTVSRSSPGGRGMTFSDGVTIDAHHNFNGSGPTAFGGAKQWPHVTMHMSFVEGDEPRRDEFVRALQGFIDHWLGPPPPCATDE